MLFLKRKKKFVFKISQKSSSIKKPQKNYLGGGSPSEKRYEELLNEYGEDRVETTSLGIKIFPTGEQFVIDAKTGRIIKRDKSVRYLGRDEETGFHFYLAEGNELDKSDEAQPSFVAEKELI